jgi:glutamyl-tRNA synthetase
MGANAETSNSILPVRGRYAPSPTGELHLGNVRTALVAWLGTRAAGGTFVLRVEDLDVPRIVIGAEARALEDLCWLGLDWDEGPDVGGPHSPYRQSQRLECFREALVQLKASGRLYGCQCSRMDLRVLASAPHGDDGPIYSGKCVSRCLPFNLDDQPDRHQRQAALRFSVTPGEWCFNDRIAGRACQDVAASVGDFVVRRADGLYAYQLAVVVDDGLMGITQVVRGNDLLGSTARQMQLQAALGIPLPEYAHVPLVLDDKGRRLAKRDQATGIRDLRSAGVPPERVIGLLASSLGLTERPQALTARELLPAFAWEKVLTAPWTCTPQDLAWLREG